MAKRGSAQAKLDRVVDLIAAAMKSDVCSIYLLRDNELELFATHGLRKEAVHVTRLRMGEGLVGTIAGRAASSISPKRQTIPPSPIARKPARSASTASPACRSSASKARSACSPSSTPSRAVTKMSRSRRCRPWRWCCRELIAGARLVDGARRGRLRSAGPLRLSGLKLVAGMAKGQAVFHEPRVIVEHTVADDTEAERARVYAAFRKMREQIDDMTRETEFGTDRRASGDPRDL